MSGYHGMPEATARVLLPRGSSVLWYRTGDLVRQDAGGQLHLLGRRDGMIKSRGYRIELGEIESILHQHPAVAEAAAVALPDEEIGNAIQAVAVARAAVDRGARLAPAREHRQSRSRTAAGRVVGRLRPSGAQQIPAAAGL
jgi:acyl-coenzyme A synthetase/AMP-(fatty) acid ligase